MELFYSTYVNKVDRKGRVSVPATFRSTLASNKTPNQIIIYPSFQLPALECSGSDRMEEMQERIESLPQFSEEYENLSQLFADSHALSIDTEGRIVMPERLKEMINAADEIAFVGRGKTFQLWQPAAYEEHSIAVRERSRRQGTTLPPRNPAPRPL